MSIGVEPLTLPYSRIRKRRCAICRRRRELGENDLCAPCERAVVESPVLVKAYRPWLVGIAIGYIVAPIALIASALQGPETAWQAGSLPLQLIMPVLACIAVSLVFQPQPGRTELQVLSRLAQFLANAVFFLPFGIAIRYIAYEVVPWDYDRTLRLAVDPDIFNVTLILVIALPTRMLAHLRRVRLAPMPILPKYLILFACAVGSVTWVLSNPPSPMMFSALPPLVFLFVVPVGEFVYWCVRGWKTKGERSEKGIGHL